MRGFNTGVSAPITYTSSNHKGGGYCRVYKANVEKTILVPVTDWRRSLSPEEIKRARSE